MTPQRIGDMMVVGAMSPALARALGVIATMMHPSFDFNPRIETGWSKKSCVLASLTVRDFLTAIGLDARVRPVATVMAAERNGERLHSLVIGSGEAQVRDGHWDGHLIVTTGAFLIDTTLYYCRRDAWPVMPGMAAVPIQRGRRPMYAGLKPIAGLTATDGDDPGYTFSMVWLDNPANRGWEIGPDATRNADLRAPVVTAMVGKFSADKRSAVA